MYSRLEVVPELDGGFKEGAVSTTGVVRGGKRALSEFPGLVGERRQEGEDCNDDGRSAGSTFLVMLAIGPILSLPRILVKPKELMYCLSLQVFRPATDLEK